MSLSEAISPTPGSAWSRATAVLLGLIAIGTALVVTIRFENPGDYLTDAGPSVIALSHLDFHLAWLHPAVMGPASILLRAPFVALSRALGAGQTGQYETGAAVCLMIAGLVGAGIAFMNRQASRSVIFLVLVTLLAVGNPAVIDAVRFGHPEEPLGAALCVAALVLVSRSRFALGAVALGLAIATKQWAILAVGPVLLATPPGRRLRLTLTAGSLAALLTAPFFFGDPHAFLETMRGTTSTQGLPTTVASWLFPVSTPTHLILGGGIPVTAHVTQTWLASSARLVIVAAGIPLTLLVARRRGRPEDVYGLLALLFLIRCVLDPINLLYYHAPLVFALLAWEVAGRRRSFPIVTMLTMTGLWFSLRFVVFRASAEVTNITYLVCSASLFAYLIAELFVRSRSESSATAPAGRFAVTDPTFSASL